MEEGKVGPQFRSQEHHFILLTIFLFLGANKISSPLHVSLLSHAEWLIGSQSSCLHPCFQNPTFYPRKLPKEFPLRKTVSLLKKKKKNLVLALKIMHFHSCSTSIDFSFLGIQIQWYQLRSEPKRSEVLFLSLNCWVCESSCSSPCCCQP